MNYNELKSGTDIRGVASDLGGKKVNLSIEAVEDITSAFVVWYVKVLKEIVLMLRKRIA